MIHVSYTYELPYVHGSEWSQRAQPVLRIEIHNSMDENLAVQVNAHLDSGTDITIFQGDLCPAIGLELMSGPEKRFQSAKSSGPPLVARLHRVRLAHDALGEREMDVAFATEPLGRNLLGLDFFNFFKIGFQDRESRVLLEAE